MNRHNACGFTLVELMAVLLIISILAAWAVPSFLDMTRGNRAQAQANLLQQSFNYARSEAVRRNSRVFVTSLNGDKDWGAKGWRVWVDQNGDGSYTENVDPDLQEQPSLTGGGSLVSLDASSEVVFLGNGFLNKNLSDNPIVFEYRIDAKCSLGRDIRLMPAGRVSVEPEDC